jgi:choice-of-anchor B domain-containing protein
MKLGALFASLLVGAASAKEELHCTGSCIGGDPNSLMSQTKAAKEADWALQEAQGLLPNLNSTSVRGLKSKLSCSNGQVQAGSRSYACENVNMYSFMNLADLSTGATPQAGYTRTSDIWGWTSADGTDITILCMGNAVTFIDNTNPSMPVHVASMFSEQERAASWCDVKVHKDVAYVVKDSAPNQGIQVFDLNRLATEGNADFPPSLLPDVKYQEHGSSHNLAIDTESEFLYSVGSNTCRGGLHMIDISEPLNPTFVGCADSDGYVHDAQCVVYTGPDTRYTGKQICFGFNEDTLTIYDVTDKSNPVVVFRLGYQGSAYTHQGWLNAEMTSLLLNDELDEQRGTTNGRRTRTYVWDITNLENAFETGRFDHPEVSIDHNLYMWGPIHRNGWGGNPAVPNTDISDDYAYLSNYCSGIRIVDITQMESGTISQAGYFDTDNCSGATFAGTWSNYMFPNGVLAVANIGDGVFFLDFANTKKN